ncbi:phosphatases II [Trametopsis cervina]|nr:phosphatases II [Trametopsis cervina]
MDDRYAEGHMNEIIPNLWIGDLPSALNIAVLQKNNIHSILSAMRGTVRVAETFNRLQISLDDTEDEDILKHLVTCIAFIQAEIDKNRGVLVHCLAGISRSVSIVTGYLMYSKGLTVEEALHLIREFRPEADPNSNFVNQLTIFHKASYNVSKHDKSIRMFYLERFVKDLKNGKFDADDIPVVYYPPSGLSQATPEAPRRRIRCKMCRQELATRENMVDHGQLSPPTPSVSYSPVISSGSSFAEPPKVLSSPTAATLDEQTSIKSADVDEAVKLGQSLSRRVSESEIPSSQRPSPLKTTTFAHPSELSAQLMSNPNIAALRSGLRVIPEPSPSLMTMRGSPILANAQCSGYFVEPLQWMEPMLEQGQMSGKIICPNKKCRAKLGNYDWAGVCCSCKEWVVPGFCIHRSKVDELA